MSTTAAQHYEEQVRSETYTSTTTSTSTSDSGVLDRRYIKGIPGLLKAIEAVCCLIAYICVEASGVFCAAFPLTTGFFKFITMFCFTCVIVLYVMLLLKFQRRIFRCACVNWPFVEAMFYAGVLVFLFFGDLFMSLHACHNAHKAGVFFGWLALIAFGIDGFVAFRTYWQSRQLSRNSGTASSPYDDNGQPKY